MQTGENVQALRQILDFIRYGSIAVLLIHFYCTCYDAVTKWNLSVGIINTLVFNFSKNIPGLSGIIMPKAVVLLLLFTSVAGVKGKKDDKVSSQTIVIYFLLGLLFYFASYFLLKLNSAPSVVAGLYICSTSVGYLLLLAGASKISRLLKVQRKDIFNDWNESFPQEEELIENEYSVNLPTEYSFQGKIRKGWINLCNIFRGTIVAGTPGSGKTFYVFRSILEQLTAKKFCFFLYDFKFPDLTLILYNHALKHASQYPVKPNFYILNFDDLARTHRCNVLYPETMTDLSDASESSRTLMLALNRDFIKKQGDFFVESSINFTTALFWFLRRYQNGRFCSLPHVVELSMIDYDELFPVLSLEESISVLINPFISAYLRSATDQLEGQIASAKIALARLVSPSIYYVLTGSDFTLDVNNPSDPKFIAVGNNPAKQSTYGAVLSLYVERMHKLINKKGQQQCALIYDEYPTLTASVDLISTARSNKIAVFIGVQDMSQLVRDYGKEQAEVISNICGNIISGQVLGESAKTLSERIGKINQEKESLSINSGDTSLSKSTQLDSAVPISRISNLSSGEFVGTVSDTPQQPIKRKAFYCRIVNNPEAIKKEEEGYQQLPIIRNIDEQTVIENFYKVRQDIKNLIAEEMEKIKEDPQLKKLADKRKKSKNTATSR